MHHRNLLCKLGSAPPQQAWLSWGAQQGGDGHLHACVRLPAVLAALAAVGLQQHAVGAPGELGNARHDAAVKLADAVVEEPPLLAVQRGQHLQGRGAGKAGLRGRLESRQPGPSGGSSGSK